MKFTNLQVGRIVAATVVLASHACYYGNYMLGIPNIVDSLMPAYLIRTTIVFLFALSGFILAHCLQTAPFGSFVKFRLIRLFPAYLFALLAVHLIRWGINEPLHFTWRRLWYAIVLWPAGPNRAAYSLGVEWTLVYELFLSMAIVPLAMIHRQKGLAWGAGIWLGLCLAKQIVWPDYEPLWLPRRQEILLSIVNVPFLLGILVYLSHRHWKPSRLLFVAAVAVIFAGRPFLESVNQWSYVFQSFGSAMLVGYFAINKQLKPSNALVASGDWAYGVYLAHVPILMGAFGLIHKQGWPLATHLTVIVVSILALAVGILYGKLEWASYRYYRAKARPKPDSEQPTTLAFPTREAAPMRRAA